VLVDLDTNKPIELVESRRVEDIRKILIEWGSQVHKNFRFWILDFGFWIEEEGVLHHIPYILIPSSI